MEIQDLMSLITPFLKAFRLSKLKFLTNVLMSGTKTYFWCHNFKLKKKIWYKVIQNLYHPNLLLELFPVILKKGYSVGYGTIRYGTVRYGTVRTRYKIQTPYCIKEENKF